MKKINTLFVLLLLASASLGFTSCSDDVEGPENPLPAPGNISYTATHNAVTVSWDAVPEAVSYMTEWKDADGNVTEHAAGETKASFTNLDAGVSYSFRVMAMASNAALNSEYSTWIIVKAAEQLTLAVPENLEITELTSESAVVLWNEVENAGKYFAEVSDADGNTTEYEADEAFLSLAGLNPEAGYSVRVQAVGGGEYLDSEFTEWLEFITPEGDVALNFGGGTGSEASPYIIMTPGQLALMAQKINDKEEDYVNACYSIGADIDLGGRDWTPIGSDEENPFHGKIDGGKYTVSNLNCVANGNEETCLAGLFGINYGTIANIYVEGYVEADSAYSGSGGYSYASGVCAVNTSSGMISGCKFTGSAKAGSQTDEYSVVIAAGICALFESGQLNDCEVTIPEGSSFEALGMRCIAAGVCGYANAGSMSNNKATIHGDLTSNVYSTANLSSIPGPAATASGIVGGTFAIMFNGAEAIITGNLKANNPAGVAYATGVCGSTEADAFAGGRADISGTLEAVSAGGNVYAAGVLGAAQGAYGLGGCSATISGSISAKTTGSSSYGAWVAGIGAHIGNAANSISVSGNHAVISGSLYSESQGGTFASGVFAQLTGNITNSSAILESGSKVEMKSGQQYFGGVVGSGATANIRASYAIIDGTVTASSGQVAMMGGVSGAFGGATTAQRRTMTGCYALIGGSISYGSAATGFTGAITGNSGRYGTMVSDFWWSTDTNTVQPHGANASATGAKQFLSRDQAGLEAALTELNASIVDYAFEYVYDSAKGWLVVRSTE